MVKEGDQGLDHIARTIFGGFMTFQEIAAVNNIPDPNQIVVGQRLRIPLPCSYDDVDGVRVVHYGHVVAKGSSVSQIAGEFGTTEATLMSLNSQTLSDPKNLQARQILDVPLKTCSSPFDLLLVPNGSYSLTANNYVKCSCNLTDLKSQCMLAEGVPVSKWTRCPPAQCGPLSLGQSQILTSTCSRTCEFSGISESSILTILANQSTCSSK